MIKRTSRAAWRQISLKGHVFYSLEWFAMLPASIRTWQMVDRQSHRLALGHTTILLSGGVSDPGVTPLGLGKRSRPEFPWVGHTIKAIHLAVRARAETDSCVREHEFK